MRTLTSDSGHEETVSVRRSESSDAEGISLLISPTVEAVFGKISIINLLEKANLAVTLANEKDQIVAHASFLDHPFGGLVDQAEWEPFLQQHFSSEKCTPMNTLFLHLFVAQPGFTTASVKEIIKAVFINVPELENICLLGPSLSQLEPGLEQMFRLMQHQTDPRPQCLARICHRQDHYPKAVVRPARVEDHDDIMSLFAKQPKVPSVFQQPYFLVQLIEDQTHNNHTAVCQVGGVTVGFISVTTRVDVKQLQDNFDLSQFSDLHQKMEEKDHDAAAESEKEEEAAAEPEKEEEAAAESEKEEEAAAESEKKEGSPSSSEHEEEQSTEDTQAPSGLKAFCIQFFTFDKKYEMRSMDFIPYIFKLFPDQDLCIITVPHVFGEFPLLQSFSRVPPRTLFNSFPQEVYVFHRHGLRSVEVRKFVTSDRACVWDLVKDLRFSQSLLQDLDCSQDGVLLQAFVVVAGTEVVGVLVIRKEEDIEYICGRYNIENYIYFSEHCPEEHAGLLHFVLAARFQHFTKHIFKEVLRLASVSCLYHHAHPSELQQQEENSCIPNLDLFLNCAVPVRPRRQIIYPLEELGTNSPSRRITEEQPGFSVGLISRKLTMEPKVTVNARVVVVGASDTGLSFLEVLCSCPHLRFNNLTLISTHGFPGDYQDEDAGFLSTSHGYSSRDLTLVPLRSHIHVITGKMVGLCRKSKHILVSSGGTVPYDLLVLCTGLQYQVPCPSGEVGQSVPNVRLQAQCAQRSYTGPMPSNLFTLNDLQDCRVAQRWICANSLELQDNAVVYGGGVDVYTAVEALLGLGIQGSCIHLVLLPSEDGVSCFSDASVDKAVTAALKTAEVHVHRNCVLAQMNDGQHPEPLRTLSFTTDAEPLHLRCGFFINVSTKAVDRDAFRSITKSYLVFDSRLVINSSFRTYDPSIFGAGPLTKFSRRYYSDEWTHANFNSREVGRALATEVLPMFDPTLKPTDHTPDSERLIPVYKDAKIQGGRLPRGLNYLHVTKPSPNIPAPPVQRVQESVIKTGRAELGNYFCLHLNSHQQVETLTCLSLKPLPLSNYLCLYGKHQLLLSQLSTHHQHGLIPDLYSFFSQSCFMAIFHDRFSDLEEELREGLKNKHTDEESDTFLLDADGRAAVRNMAVKFLCCNRNLLPMFAPTPSHT